MIITALRHGSRLAARPGEHLGARVAAVVDGELDPGDQQRALSHVARCQQCRAALAEQRAARRLVAALPPPPPPSGLIHRLEQLPLDRPTEAAPARAGASRTDARLPDVPPAPSPAGAHRGHPSPGRAAAPGPGGHRSPLRPPGPVPARPRRLRLVALGAASVGLVALTSLPTVAGRGSAGQTAARAAGTASATAAVRAALPRASAPRSWAQTAGAASRAIVVPAGTGAGTAVLARQVAGPGTVLPESARPGVTGFSVTGTTGSARAPGAPLSWPGPLPGRRLPGRTGPVVPVMPAALLSFR